MIWNSAITTRSTKYTARQGNHQYIVQREDGMWAARHRMLGDEVGELLGYYPTEAHAKDAAVDHQLERKMR